MIITEKEIVIHRPDTVLDYKTLKDAINGWFCTALFPHPLDQSPIIMYCDDNYIQKELPLNPVATHLYNISRAQKDFHPVLGPAVLTQSVEEGNSAELSRKAIADLLLLLVGPLNSVAITQFAEFLESDDETLTISLEPVKTLEKVTFLKNGDMKREEIKGFQSTMTYWHPADYVTIDTSHPEYRKRIKEHGRTAFYNKLKDQAAISFK